MKFNKWLQYGFLLVLYTSRGGRINIKTAAENLGLPYHFLYQVALKLKRNSVLKSIRGPSGGYELNPESTVGDVFRVFVPTFFLTGRERFKYVSGSQEHRVMLNFVQGMDSVTAKLMKRKVNNLCNEFAINEMNIVDKLPIPDLVN